MRESILNHLALGENVIAKRKRLGKLLDIPYFGRIDFREKYPESKTTPIYIGIYTFYDFKKKTNLIYDWRAPISAIFYDCELGQASYSAPSGEVTGQISLKRQYRIRKGEMEYMSLEKIDKAMINKLTEIGIDVGKDLSVKDLTSNFRQYWLSKNDIVLTKKYQLIVHEPSGYVYHWCFGGIIGYRHTRIGKLQQHYGNCKSVGYYFIYLLRHNVY